MHISQICSDRGQKVEAFLHEGQDIDVLVAGVDKQGKVKLEWLNKPGAVVKEPEKETSESTSAESVSSESAESEILQLELPPE